MSSGERIPLSQARELAWEVMELLAPFCAQITIAGSIRRQRLTIGDLELVLLPLYSEPDADLFGEPLGPGANLLDARCDWLFEQGTFGKRYDKNGRPRWGSGLKWATYKDVNLDLFPVVGDTAQWGVDLLIRTGSADFSHRFVSPCERRIFNSAGRDLGKGWIPAGYRVERGALWHEDAILATPTEHEVFAAIGRPYVEPCDREV